MTPPFDRRLRSGLNWIALPLVLLGVVVLHRKCGSRCATLLLFTYGLSLAMIAVGGLICSGVDIVAPMHAASAPSPSPWRSFRADADGSRVIELIWRLANQSEGARGLLVHPHAGGDDVEERG